MSRPPPWLYAGRSLLLLISYFIEISVACSTQSPSWNSMLGMNDFCDGRDGNDRSRLSGFEEPLLGKSQADIDLVDLEDGLPNSEYIYTIATPSKGLAVVARKSIPAGTAIIIEAPLFTVPVPAMVPGKGFPIHEMSASITSSFQSLVSSHQSDFLSLHNHRHVSEEDLSSDPRSSANLLSIFRTNAYNTGEKEVGVFPAIARINHSCRPNAGNWWSEARKERVIWAMRDIAKGKEVSVSYIPLLKSRQERAKRLEQYGFMCDCEACTAEAKEGKMSDRRRRRIQDGMEDLSGKLGDGKDRVREVWEKVYQKAQRLVEIVKEEQVWDYEGDVVGLAGQLAQRCRRDEDLVMWAQRAEVIEKWKEGNRP